MTFVRMDRSDSGQRPVAERATKLLKSNHYESRKREHQGTSPYPNPSSPKETEGLDLWGGKPSNRSHSSSSGVLKKS